MGFCSQKQLPVAASTLPSFPRLEVCHLKPRQGGIFRQNFQRPLRSIVTPFFFPSFNPTKWTAFAAQHSLFKPSNERLASFLALFLHSHFPQNVSLHHRPNPLHFHPTLRVLLFLLPVPIRKSLLIHLFPPTPHQPHENLHVQFQL